MILPLLVETLTSVLYVALTFLSAFGIGTLILSQRRVHSIWQVCLAIVLGFLLLSQMHYYAFAFSIYRYSFFLWIKGLTVAWVIVVLWRSRINHIVLKLGRESKLFRITLLLYLVLATTLVIANASSLRIHGDAKQYHLAFPWIMSLTQELFRDNSFIGTGVYQGFDFLYLYVTNLSLLENNYRILLHVKVFSTLVSFLLPISIYYLCRFMGAGKDSSIVASLSLFTVSSIVSWGELKNDIVSAGLFLFFLAVLINAWKSGLRREFYVACALAGFALSAKITNLAFSFFVFPLIVFWKKASFQTKLNGLILVAIILAPWVWLAYSTQANPIHSALMNLPPELEAGWDKRNANGLTLSLSNFIIYLPQLILDRYEISGNNSLGFPFVISLCFSCFAFGLVIVKRKGSIIDGIFLAGLLWFLFFSVSRFDGRFLSRYILNFVGITFTYAFVSMDALLSKSVKNQARQWLLTFFLIVFSVLGYFTDWAKVRINYLRSFSLVEGVDYKSYRQRQFDQATNLELRTVIEQLRGNGAVAVNDAFVLLIDPPFVNVHGLHAAQLNLYTKDSDFVREFLAKRNVSVLVFRNGISGITPALTEFIEECTDFVQSVEAREVYTIKAQCHS
ncbi:MAG: hypothetical protein ACFB14_04765 [Leptolyngbyaceae cyanobacterium]